MTYIPSHCLYFYVGVRSNNYHTSADEVCQQAYEYLGTCAVCLQGTFTGKYVHIACCVCQLPVHLKLI